MEGEQSFAEALRRWQDIGLGVLQKELDTQGMSILQNQKDSMNSRKQLAELTRDFKKVPEEEKQNSFKTVLKAYQAEIDHLTKRSKFAETSFLSLYKLLADAPDPAALLANAIEERKKLSQVEALTNENKRLRDELDNATKDFVDMKNQASTVARLKEKLAEYDTKIDKQVKQRIAERETQLREEFEGKLRTYKEREYDLERQLSRCKDQVVALQSNNDSTQATMLSHSVRFDEAVSAKLAELELINLELERATEKISSVEREKEMLRAEVTRLKQAAPQANTGLSDKQLRQFEEQILAKDNEILRLQDAIGKLNKASVSKQVSHSSAIMDLQVKISELTEEIEGLNERLAEMKDYDDVKRELSILKTIEFSSPGAGDDDDVNNSGEWTGATLETLLVRKNKRLQAEIMSIKVRNDELEAQLAEAILREQSTRVITSEQQALIARLEEDIVLLNAVHEPHTHSPDALGSLEESKKNMDASIIPIVTSQRDRYRKRNQELEETAKKLEQTIQELKVRLGVLTDDNVKLYEKIRFLEIFREERLISKQSAPVVLDMNADVASKYKSMYEDKLNPFAEFNEKERRKHYVNLNVAERATLNVSRFFLASKHARSFIFFYTVILHVFLLSVIYGMSVREACVHDHELSKALAE